MEREIISIVLKKIMNGSYEPLSDENQLEVLAMLMEWKMQNCDPEDIEKHDEICVSKNCVINYKELGLVGGVLRAEGKVVGFSIGERASNEDTFIVHIEKLLQISKELIR